MELGMQWFEKMVLDEGLNGEGTKDKALVGCDLAWTTVRAHVQ